MKKAIELIEQADTKGIQVQIAGRIDGKEMARVEWIREGKVPLQTIRAKMDFCSYTVRTIYGNPRLKKKAPESAQGQISSKRTVLTCRRYREMFAFGMKMDEQALEPGTDEIRRKHGTGHYTWGARHDRDLRFNVEKTKGTGE
ncbi:hypothetical protein LguiB_012918 [Lonicera macranthoides]